MGGSGKGAGGLSASKDALQCFTQALNYDVGHADAHIGLASLLLEAPIG